MYWLIRYYYKLIWELLLMFPWYCFCSHIPDHPEYQAGLVMTTTHGASLPLYPRSISRWYPGCTSPLPMVHLSWVPRPASSSGPPLGLSQAQQHKPTLHLPLCLSLYLSASIPVCLYTCSSLCFSVWPGESCKGR